MNTPRRNEQTIKISSFDMNVYDFHENYEISKGDK